MLEQGCVLAGTARTQRLGRASLHVAAASTQSARYAARGGTPVPKNSVLIVGATGTLGGSFKGPLCLCKCCWLLGPHIEQVALT